MEKETIKDIMSEFGDTTEKLYFHIAKMQGYNIETVKFLNR